MPLFTDDVIIYIDSLNESTKQLLEITSEFSKVSGYKVNIKIIFLCTSRKQLQNNFKINIKYLNLTKICKISTLTITKCCLETLKKIYINGEINHIYEYRRLYCKEINSLKFIDPKQSQS